MLFSNEANIKMIMMDVDGVLTGGEIILGPNGEEFKIFNVQDGLGIKLAHKAGIMTAIITGRSSNVVLRRAKELDITDVYQDVVDKEVAFDEILQKHNLKENQVAYIGDDLNDLKVMKRAGLAIAVANAVEEVKSVADFITELPGGKGAVREVVVFILKKKGLWKDIVNKYHKLS